MGIQLLFGITHSLSDVVTVQVYYVLVPTPYITDKLCVCVCACRPMCACACVYLPVSMYVCMCVCVFTCVCSVCVYLHVCMRARVFC